MKMLAPSLWENPSLWADPCPLATPGLWARMNRFYATRMSKAPQESKLERKIAMAIEPERKIAFLTIITGRKNKDAILKALHDSGICLINTVYGKGTVKAGYLQNAFGLVPEEKKAVITCLPTCAKIKPVLKLLEDQFGFNKPNTGIAFTVPVDMVS